MKNKFLWYFPYDEKELDYIWENAILTLDANVLLELYRYHENTRNALLNSIKSFRGRAWLSNQAAEEFVRNRKKVIFNSRDTFVQADKEIQKLKKGLEAAVSQLRGNRIIPSDIANDLLGEIIPKIEGAAEAVSKIKDEHPDYLRNDPILEDISEIFDGHVGEGFSDEDLSAYIDEAEKRIDNEIPPGYLDSGKGGDRKYGDYFLWMQTLINAKEKDRPVIFVTSERKEDWWEKESDKILGPRPELLREAYEFIGRRVLIYQTDLFLKYYSLREGKDFDKEAAEEIRAVDSRRSNTGHAVEVVGHEIIEASKYTQKGFLVLDLVRPVKNMTGGGVFEPFMESIPSVDVSLISAPEELDQYALRAGAGTNFNFSLHVLAEEGGRLPVGRYKLQYSAVCEIKESRVTDLARIVGVPEEKLLGQLNDAGVDVFDAEDFVSSEDKARLLKYLRASFKK